MFNEHLMIHLEYKISSESLVLLFKPISQSDSSHSSRKYFFYSVKNKALEASQGIHSDIEFTGFVWNNMQKYFSDARP